MKDILKKSTVAFILILILIFLILVIGHLRNNNVVLKKQVTSEINLRNALTDSVHTYRNQRNEIVAEKLTLQYKYNDLLKQKTTLTESQNALLTRIKEQDKKYEIIAAAYISQVVKVDSLKKILVSKIDSLNNNICFEKNDSLMDIDVTITNVLPLKDSIIDMIINTLKLKNKQFISFNWDLKDKKNNYPVSFSIVNSNPYFLTQNIDSYIIPQIKKDELKPTFWQKAGKFFSNIKDKTIVFGIGLGIGFMLFH